MIFIFWMLRFKSAFSLSSFTFIKRLFSSSSAIRVVSSAYLRLLIFPLAIYRGRKCRLTKTQSLYILGGGSKTGVVIFRGGREGRLNMRNVVLFFCFTSSMMSQPRPVKTQPLWALSPRVLFIFRCFSGCYSLQDLSSPIRDWTQAPGSESVES